MIKFTKTEQRILDELAGGMTKSCDELKECLDDDLADVCPTLRKHISNLRGKLVNVGKDVLCRKGRYRLVGLTTSSDE